MRGFYDIRIVKYYLLIWGKHLSVVDSKKSENRLIIACPDGYSVIYFHL